MTLLSIGQYAADEAGLSRPSSIVGSTNTTARQLLQFAHRTGRDLVQKSHPYLVKIGTFDTVSSQQSYDFEDDMSITDWDHFVPFTAWNQDESRRWIPVSPQEWQEYQSGLATVSINQRYRILGKDRKVYLHETPTAAETIQFEYVSSHYCESTGGTSQARWAADNDTSVGDLDEELFELGVLWRILRRLGLSYADERREYDSVLMQNLARNKTPRVLSADGHSESIGNIKDANWPSSGL